MEDVSYERYLEELDSKLSEEFTEYQGMTMASCYKEVIWQN